MPPKRRKTAAAGCLIGYARVSTEEQGTDPQCDELRAASCAIVLEEHASGADRSRPVLARLLRDIAPGETLVVVPLDRLARSVSHLLSVIEQLEASGAHSLRDPIDTSTPQGMFSLQVLGAVAQLERALIAERTKAGCQPRVTAAALVAIPACGPATRKRSAKFKSAATPRISRVSWRIWTPGSRPCGGCAPVSPGVTWCVF
jgi:Resolvase, N terminal domain